MQDYKSLYFFLFNGITDIIGEMEKAENRNDNIRFIQYLKILQAGSEELYLKQGDDDDDDDGQT